MICQEKTVPIKHATAADKILRVCFVCTGNTCRSPMAQAVANDLSRKGQSGACEVIAGSAGLYAHANDPITPYAVQVLEEAGIEPIGGMDYRDHRALPLTEEMAERYDLLVGMSGAHTMELLMRFPHLAQRITAMPRPISDPYGGNLECYRDCLTEIVAGVKQLLFSGAGDSI